MHWELPKSGLACDYRRSWLSFLRSKKQRLQNRWPASGKKRASWMLKYPKWDDSGNDIIVLAKQMCMIMMEMTDFTRWAEAHSADSAERGRLLLHDPDALLTSLLHSPPTRRGFIDRDPVLFSEAKGHSKIHQMWSVLPRKSPRRDPGWISLAEQLQIM